MRPGPRMLTVAVVLSLPPAAPTSCPAGWTPLPATGGTKGTDGIAASGDVGAAATRAADGAALGSRCFLVPPKRSTSLLRCVSLCEEHGGVPACIRSAEENDFVRLLQGAGALTTDAAALVT